jgi:hypothetical protein
VQGKQFGRGRFHGDKQTPPAPAAQD